MAHAFGRRALSHTSSTGNPISVSLTVNPGETVACLMLKVVGATNRAGGAPTWAGSTFTQRNSTQKAAASPEASAELWDLLNPLPGTYTLTIPNTGALTVFYEVDTASAAAGGHSEFEAANGANATAANPSPGAVTMSAGGIAFAIVATGAQTWSPSAQAGTIINNTDDGADGTGRQYSTTSGSLTLSWTFATSDDYGAVVACYREVPPHGFANYMRPTSAGAFCPVS